MFMRRGLRREIELAYACVEGEKAGCMHVFDSDRMT